MKRNDIDVMDVSHHQSHHTLYYLSIAIHISPPQLTQARHARSLAFSRFAAFSLLHQIKSSPCIHILLTISTPPPLLFYIIFFTIYYICLLNITISIQIVLLSYYFCKIIIFKLNIQCAYIFMEQFVLLHPTTFTTPKSCIGFKNLQL